MSVVTVMPAEVGVLSRTYFAHKHVVFSGSRAIRPGDTKYVEQHVQEVMMGPPDSVYVGGASGVDTIVFRTVAKLITAQVGGCDEVVIVTPSTLADCPRAFREAVRESRLPVHRFVPGQPTGTIRGPHALLLEMLLDPANPASYHERNRHMLDSALQRGSTSLVAFPVEGKVQSGTRSTIHAAQKREVAVYEMTVRV